jgi:hypothetical protein
MISSNQKAAERWSRGSLVLLAAMTAVYVSSSWSAGTGSRVPQQTTTDAPRAELSAAVFRSASAAVTAGFAPSLEMKENVHSVLTPALLVQEALSEDTIVTYPSE